MKKKEAKESEGRRVGGRNGGMNLLIWKKEKQEKYRGQTKNGSAAEPVECRNGMNGDIEVVATRERDTQEDRQKGRGVWGGKLLLVFGSFVKNIFIDFR